MQYEKLPGYNFTPHTFNPIPIGSYFSRDVPKLEVTDTASAVAPVATAITAAILGKPERDLRKQQVADSRRDAALQEELKRKMADPAFAGMIEAGPKGLTLDPLMPSKRAYYENRGVGTRRAGDPAMSAWDIDNIGNRGAFVNPQGALQVPGTAEATIDDGVDLSGVSVDSDLPVSSTDFSNLEPNQLFATTGPIAAPTVESEAESADLSGARFDAPAPVSATPATNQPIVAGNIDLSNRPLVENPKGGTSTVYSMSFGTDKGEILIPQVAEDGSRILSPDEAIAQYQRTGKHLGIFSSPEAADAYGKQLSGDQSKQYGLDSPPAPTDTIQIPTFEDRVARANDAMRNRKPVAKTSNGTPVYEDERGQKYLSAGIATSKDGIPVEMRTYSWSKVDRSGQPVREMVPLVTKQRLPAKMQSELVERGIDFDDYTTPKEAMAALRASRTGIDGVATPKLTEQQAKTAFFAPRMIEGNDALEGIMKTYDPTGFQGAKDKAAVGQWWSNFMASKEGQAFDKAGKLFLTGVLRKDSGAAITKDEWAAYGPMFLPQPGDEGLVLDLKKKARATAIEAANIGLPAEAVVAVMKIARDGGEPAKAMEAFSSTYQNPVAPTPAPSSAPAVKPPELIEIENNPALTWQEKAAQMKALRDKAKAQKVAPATPAAPAGDAEPLFNLASAGWM